LNHATEVLTIQKRLQSTNIETFSDEGATCSHEERFIASRQSMIEEEPGYFLSQK
jgi:hypothetical protein